MINSINPSTNSVQLLPSNRPTSPVQLNQQALQPTTAAQQNRQAAQAQQVQNEVQNAYPPHATMNTSGQTVGSVINVVA